MKSFWSILVIVLFTSFSSTGSAETFQLTGTLGQSGQLALRLITEKGADANRLGHFQAEVTGANGLIRGFGFNTGASLWILLETATILELNFLLDEAIGSGKPPAADRNNAGIALPDAQPFSATANIYDGAFNQLSSNRYGGFYTVTP